MKKQEVTVTNPLGIHARPASLIVQTAAKFQAEVWLEKDDMEANAKSIMSVMMLTATFQSKIIIRAQGKDEVEAIAAVAALFALNFNEK